MAREYYTVEYYEEFRHKTTGKLLLSREYITRQGWRPIDGIYDTLKEAIEDNPPCKYPLRVVRCYEKEIVHNIPSPGETEVPGEFDKLKALQEA